MKLFIEVWKISAKFKAMLVYIITLYIIVKGYEDLELSKDSKGV